MGEDEGGAGDVADSAGAGPSTACQKQLSALLPRGVPRRRRSAASSLAANHTTSLGTSSVGTRTTLTYGDRIQ